VGRGEIEGEEHMSDSYDDYELQIQLAEHAWEQALEEKQEPAAWMHNFIEGNVITHIPADIGRHPERWTPLYTAPPRKEWVGLTDDEIQDLGYLSEKFDASNSEWFDRWGFARAIEAKLKEKNGGEYRNGATTERTKLNQENT
jgi:hypothetical protein